MTYGAHKLVHSEPFWTISGCPGVVGGLKSCIRLSILFLEVKQ